MTAEYRIRRYVKAKIAWVKCMQKHFRQLCGRCHKLTGCAVYREYCDAWIELQEKEND